MLSTGSPRSGETHAGSTENTSIGHTHNYNLRTHGIPCQLGHVKYVNFYKRRKVGALVPDLPPDFRPIEMGLTIDHILEQILDSLKRSDLLKSRLVSRRWNSRATSLLQKEMQLKFTLPKKPFKSFTRLIQNPVKPPNFPPSPFPCSHFTLENSLASNEPLLEDTTLQKFLKIHGPHITYLSLKCEGHLLKEALAMDQIQNLVLHEVPNVVTLSINLNYEVEWEESQHSRTQDRYQPLRLSDPEILKIESKINCIRELNTKLKTLHLPNHKLRVFSAKVLEMLIFLCPNVQEIITEECNYMYLLEPKNRLFFLKQFRFTLFSTHDLDMYEKLLNVDNPDISVGPVQFRDVYFWHVDHIFSRRNQVKTAEIKRRIVSVINRIFSSAWSTIETIDWRGITAFQGLKFPKEMPNVTKITFSCPFRIGDGGSVFPHDLCWSTLCPNLKHVSLGDEKYRAKKDCIRFFNGERIESVRKVDVYGWGMSERGMEAYYGRVKEIFPFARVKQFKNPSRD